MGDKAKTVFLSSAQEEILILYKQWGILQSTFQRMISLEFPTPSS